MLTKLSNDLIYIYTYSNAHGMFTNTRNVYIMGDAVIMRDNDVKFYTCLPHNLFPSFVIRGRQE